MVLMMQVDIRLVSKFVSKTTVEAARLACRLLNPTFLVLQSGTLNPNVAMLLKCTDTRYDRIFAQMTKCQMHKCAIPVVLLAH